ncbi:MAG: WecB/TagA/CpsF family glycosyltransferase [Gomphosphaeria aponina SAG 52.96 = DSM 107014]|uniref:WecB/TagA/CpsF family glycosyltransferase n=1 Tax=Gomphosphaeria aponina SAG 52.96 = DSM 107014 TaxID=1521640 RepID=A0A941JRC7_9CHRO|nr:WecB/TagA/CpsF family glycosyltransferase [Gomphosphaeria aponina SAG 52.96 = DSM 107014]
MKPVKLLNIEIDNLSMKELLEKLTHAGGFVVTPNIDHLVKLQNDLELLKAYKIAEYRVCDSKILQYISKILGNPITEKISGSDLFPAFYQYNKNNEKVKIFLLGAEAGVAEKAKIKINQQVEREIVVDTYSPDFGFEKDELECEKILDKINKSGATVLAVGLGAPKQEKWIAKYKNQLVNVKVFLGIGATIDFEAGCVRRSPKWMSQVGLEWLFRLASEPQRLWRRYLVESLPFFGYVIQQKLNHYQFSWLLELQSLPLGLRLKKAGLISAEQLQAALEIKEQQRHRLLGEIIVEKGWVSPEVIDFFAKELDDLIESQQALRLGEYLGKANILTTKQISSILNEQSLTGKRFGEIAVKKGWVKPETIDWFLCLQQVGKYQPQSTSIVFNSNKKNKNPVPQSYKTALITGLIMLLTANNYLSH